MANNIAVKDATGTTLHMETEETSPGSGIHASRNIVKELPTEPLGSSSDAAVTSDAAGTHSGYLRGLIKWAYERMPASLGQKTKANSLSVTLASDYSISIGNVQLDAGEAHIGEVGKHLAAVANTPTITAALYAVDQCVGGVQTIASCARVSAGSGKILSVLLVDKAAQGASFDLLVFDANPTASTFTDNAGAVLHATDIDKLIGSISLKDYTVIPSGKSFCKVAVNFPFALASGNSLYFVLIVRAENGFPTYASTSDLVLRLWIEQN